MDGKGRYTDNIFVERLWRTVKYEEVYLKAYATPVKPGGNWASTSGSTTTRDLTPSLSCRCSIKGMPSKVPVKCAIAGCHRRVNMTLAEREELRRVGRENNATAGVVCPVDVKAAFNFEFDDIDIDVPLGEFLVEASKETPRWRVMLTPLPGVAGEPDSQSTPRRGDRVI